MEDIVKTRIEPGQIVTFAWARDLKELETPRLIVLGVGDISDSYRCYCYFWAEAAIYRGAPYGLGTVFEGIQRDNLVVIPDVKSRIQRKL
jgi:hypothetical protein